MGKQDLFLRSFGEAERFFEAAPRKWSGEEERLR